MKLMIEIEMGNDAFQEFPTVEVARILNTIPARMDFDGERQTIRLKDINGNMVGTAKTVFTRKRKE